MLCEASVEDLDELTTHGFKMTDFAYQIILDLRRLSDFYTCGFEIHLLQSIELALHIRLY